MTVLLVDDFEPQLNSWEREIKREGQRVLRATNRTDALREAKHTKPDVAIVDLFLGTETGLDVTRDLKAYDPQIRVVVVSANMSVACVMASVRAGADDVFAKPMRCSGILNNSESDHPPEAPALTLAQIEWEAVSAALLECDGNITRAAERLGLYRQSLQRKLRKRGKCGGGWT